MINALLLCNFHKRILLEGFPWVYAACNKTFSSLFFVMQSTIKGKSQICVKGLCSLTNMGPQLRTAPKKETINVVHDLKTEAHT